MIEYTYTMLDMKQVTISTHRSGERWALRMVHNPTGLFVTANGTGKYEHQIESRRATINDLEQQVNGYYKEQYDQLDH